jgi:hypothetical protein
MDYEVIILLFLCYGKCNKVLMEIHCNVFIVYFNVIPCIFIVFNIVLSVFSSVKAYEAILNNCISKY